VRTAVIIDVELYIAPEAFHILEEAGFLRRHGHEERVRFELCEPLRLVSMMMCQQDPIYLFNPDFAKMIENSSRSESNQKAVVFLFDEVDLPIVLPGWIKREVGSRICLRPVHFYITGHSAKHYQQTNETRHGAKTHRFEPPSEFADFLNLTPGYFPIGGMHMTPVTRNVTTSTWAERNPWRFLASLSLCGGFL
jgi:hypothetical protein